MSSDKQLVQSDVYDDARADLDEKAAIEREIARRGVTAYRSPASLTYEDVHDRCHCECWVVHLGNP